MPWQYLKRQSPVERRKTFILRRSLYLLFCPVDEWFLQRLSLSTGLRPIEKTTDHRTEAYFLPNRAVSQKRTTHITASNKKLPSPRGTDIIEVDSLWNISEKLVNMG